LKDPGSSDLPEDPEDIVQVNLYGPTKTSPAVDSGLNLKDQFSIDPGGKDLEGNILPTGMKYDIGAIEFKD